MAPTGNDPTAEWFRRLRVVAQYGLTYSKDAYDLERFREVAAIAEEMAERLTGRPLGDVTEALRLETGPPSPKLDVRAAVFRGDEILLVREASDGLWTLPGGWVDLGESPAEAARREVKEESGFDCVPRKLFAVVDRNKHPHGPLLFHVYKLFFWCELTGGSETTSLETTAVGFFREDALPPLSHTRVLATQISRAFRHREQPALATEFD
jgi:ADP-ribose pyrophosphatase YjhB (NUDIX family)